MLKNQIWGASLGPKRFCRRLRIRIFYRTLRKGRSGNGSKPKHDSLTETKYKRSKPTGVKCGYFVWRVTKHEVAVVSGFHSKWMPKWHRKGETNEHRWCLCGRFGVFCMLLKHVDFYIFVWAALGRPKMSAKLVCLIIWGSSWVNPGLQGTNILLKGIYIYIYERWFLFIQ